MHCPEMETQLFACNCSCMAVSDLLRGRSLDAVVERLAELWEILFRVRDDIKVCSVTHLSQLRHLT